MKKLKKFIIIAVAAVVVAAGVMYFSGPCYKNVDGWTAEQNKFVKNFLYESQKVKGRKAAVFDVDGTLIGQVPFYLADEVMLSFATENNLMQKQKEVIDYMLATDDTASDKYTRNRIEFFAGMTMEQMTKLGEKVWQEKYGQKKVYPEMVQLVRNLEKFGYEIYGITCSPEFVYQGVVEKYFGIPVNHIIGAKGIVTDGQMTARAVEPFPCHEGKAEVIHTFIKESPLIAAGNSSGDSAMVATSAGIKIWVNPSEKLAAECNADSKCMIVRSNDTDSGGDFAARRAGIKPNRPEPK